VHYAGGIVFVLSGVVTMWMMFSHDGWMEWEMMKNEEQMMKNEDKIFLFN
jgi:hypothetical protein